MCALSVRFHSGGVRLPDLGLWLDPHEPQRGTGVVFISHAHSDHIRDHGEVILTEPTSRLMRARLSGERSEHVLSFGQETRFEGSGRPFTITLLPAGHVLGSSMALISCEETKVLYTGDFKLQRSLTSELCDPRQAEILIMETTFGRPGYRFPPASEVFQGVIRFCRETLDEDAVPVLLGYSLGKSQELLSGLKEAQLPVMLHPQVYKLTEIYREFGKKFPEYEKLDSDAAQGKVVICPPGALGSAALKKVGRIRTAILTGWAMDPQCRYRYRTDAAFALSDHADFPDLIEMVRQVSPKMVYTMHGFAKEFAGTLREMGYDAQALSGEEQLSLPLKQQLPGVGDSESNLISRGRDQERRSGLVNVPVLKKAEGESARPIESSISFQAFASTCAEIGATPKKLEKTRILAEYLRTIDAAMLAPVSNWFTGHPFPPSQNKTLHLGWAIIRDGVCAATGIGQSDFGEVYLKHSDLGETATEILSRFHSGEFTLSLEAVDTVFQQLYVARGSNGKLPVLTQAIRKCTCVEGKFLVKILTGELRIGLKEGLVEEAIARAFDVSIEEVRTANLILGNIGESAQLAKRRELQTATVSPFRPVKFMLASPEQTAEAVLKRADGWKRQGHDRQVKIETGSQFAQAQTDASVRTEEKGEPRIWIEDKYDGIRCQLHKVGTRVALYSRDLKEITSTFLELVDSTRTVESDFIVDGEILAMRGGKALPFTDLQRRLGRKEADLFLSYEVPVCYVAFDLLWHAGESLLNRPLQIRRDTLASLGHFELSKITPAGSSDEIEAAFSAAKLRGNEGLVIKDPASDYSPGRRGISWLKLKKAFASLDCVVVGAEYGHGRRKSVLSDYTFAVRDETTGELQTIGKSFTGLTDLEIAELTRNFLGEIIKKDGRYLQVEPRVVLEIAFDSIQISQRHASGLALRFPRIVRIRKDKSPNEIDTVASAKRLLKTDKRSKQT